MKMKNVLDIIQEKEFNISLEGVAAAERVYIDYLYKSSGLDDDQKIWVLERIIKSLSSNPAIHQDCLRPIRCVDGERRECFLKRRTVTMSELAKLLG